MQYRATLSTKRPAVAGCAKTPTPLGIYGFTIKVHADGRSVTPVMKTCNVSQSYIHKWSADVAASREMANIVIGERLVPQIIIGPSR